MADIKHLEKKATQLRIDVLKTIKHAGAGHIGGSFSSIDILTVLYYHIMKVDPKNSDWEDRDRFVLSKGHIAESLWAILADKGFIDKEELATFSQFGTRLIGHPNNKVDGVEMNTGSLGHGLPIVTGMALAAKMDGKSYKSYTLMGDGELAEGSIWEAAMAAAHYKLDNLIAIVDHNDLQISGTTEEVMSTAPLADKWESFGWHVVTVNGHDMAELIHVLTTAPEIQGKPTLIIAKTIKTKGISFAENVPSWHHYVPDDAQYMAALKELEAIL